MRVWQEQPGELDDVILLTWGVNLSGLAYLGNSLPSIQSDCFNNNTLIFHMRGGYFTSHITLKTSSQMPLAFIDHLNVVSDVERTRVCRMTKIKVSVEEMNSSYNVNKLQRLHSLQIAIRNKSMEAKLVRDKINSVCGLIQNKTGELLKSSSSKDVDSNVRYAPQLLTMNSLNKMLHVRNTSHELLIFYVTYFVSYL